MSSHISGYGNKRMLLGVLAALFGIFLLWYWFHPLSPHNKRFAYVAVFNEVGPISKGANVKIGGIPKGRILRLQKTDSCIYVSFEVTSDFRLPRDSKLHFASAGFLGNRELLVFPGNSPDFFAEGDTIRNAIFDKGLNTARDDLAVALGELSAISKAAKDFLDSAQNGQIRKDGERIVRKGKRLAASTEKLSSEWKSEISRLLGDFSSAADKLENSLKEIGKGAKDFKGSGEELVSQLEHLKASAENARSELEKTLKKLESDDNSAGLLLKKGGAVSAKLQRVASDADALVQSIRKNGLKLNIDIF